MCTDRDIETIYKPYDFSLNGKALHSIVGLMVHYSNTALQEEVSLSATTGGLLVKERKEDLSDAYVISRRPKRNSEDLQQAIVKSCITCRRFLQGLPETVVSIQVCSAQVHHISGGLMQSPAQVYRTPNY